MSGPASVIAATRSSAADTALLASSSNTGGQPNTASTPSPSHWSTWPPNLSTDRLAAPYRPRAGPASPPARPVPPEPLSRRGRRTERSSRRAHPPERARGGSHDPGCQQPGALPAHRPDLFCGGPSRLEVTLRQRRLPRRQGADPSTAPGGFRRNQPNHLIHNSPIGAHSARASAAQHPIDKPRASEAIGRRESGRIVSTEQRRSASRIA